MKCTSYLTAFGAFGALVLAGCQSASSTDAPAASANAPAPDVVLIPASKINALAIGMSAAQVRQLLGQPERVTTQEAVGPGAELWTYRIGRTQRAAMATTGMQDVPGVDPFTGQTTTHKEAVYRMEHTTIYDTLQLLMLDGLLSAQKRARETERTFD
jgi:hypothetical protein